MIFKHNCEVKNGKIENLNHDQFNRNLQRLNNKKIILTVSIPKKQRSNQQNRYFHGVILPILSNHLGYFKDEMKVILKYKFLMTESKVVKSTSNLTTKEFEDFNSKIRTWASVEHCLYIPKPNEISF